MKSMKLLVVALAASTIASAPLVASALTCTSPPPGHFDDLVPITAFGDAVYLSCDSNDDGVLRDARAKARDAFQGDGVYVELFEGDYALVDGYDSNGQFIAGCAVEDFVEDDGAEVLDCGQHVRLVDLTVIDNS